ncbi:hypothetical protein LTR95_007510 [Oleoguttula sp. CCFEE 5521]
MSTSPEHQTGPATSVPTHVKREQANAPALDLPRGTKRPAAALEASEQGAHRQTPKPGPPSAGPGIEHLTAVLEKVKKDQMSDENLHRSLLAQRVREMAALGAMKLRHSAELTTAEGRILRTEGNLVKLRERISRLHDAKQKASDDLEAEMQQQRLVLADLFSGLDSDQVAKMRKLGKAGMAKMLDAENE